ncbi:uncharacterized protein Aud_002297 [Aspergillus udagawae]|uniref:Secreted protein n=1 Tax=Aspergillus udagawae TaxID=91492 RepID=A0A8E0R4S9_9EURO|nr:uncharacterized protein Aud_002297 [Aspergillus udagawae]GIC94966.1 hypothetical protein Aud_002297 [Aspergillus udagawae]
MAAVAIGSELAPTVAVVAFWMSAQAATTELNTIKPKDSRARGFTPPPTRSAISVTCRYCMRCTYGGMRKRSIGFVPELLASRRV